MAHMSLAKNIHEGLPLPHGVKFSDTFTVQGYYDYFHYGCDEKDDRGWGCGYRTLQSISSWIRYQLLLEADEKPVPSLQTIQETLVSIGDKPETFLNSRDWIGSIEVGLIIDVLYDVPCKILHVRHGGELSTHVRELEEHFKQKASPIMMGGDADAASKGIFGICHNSETSYLLVVDPHYYGTVPTTEILQQHNMLLWKKVDSFMEDSFYNLCLPQMVATKLAGK